MTCKISSLCIAAQALCRVLAQFPDVNASLQSDRRAIIRHRDHNIGVAMATHTGLVVRTSSTASSGLATLGLPWLRLGVQWGNRQH